MCFRPSALAGTDNNVQQGTCPTCGMPVAAEEGTTSGNCPYCGNAIPSGAGPSDQPTAPSQNARIL